MAKSWTLVSVLVIGMALAASITAAQEPKREEPGQETRPIPLPEEKVVAPGLTPPSPYRAPADSRSGTPIHDLPESLTVVPRPVLEEQKALRLDDVLRNVAGIARNAGRGFNDDFIIRGFRPTEGFLVLRDQFPQAIDDLSPQAELWNIDRVEVIKGPKAFLYGRSEPGGVVNLVTKRPLAEPHYQLELAIGSFDLYRPALDLTEPLGTDKVLYRLNALYEHAGSFRDFVEGDRAFVAPALTVKLTPETEVTFQFEYLHHERTHDTGVVVVGKRPGRIPIETFLNHPSNKVVADTYRASYELTHRLSEDWRIRNAFRFLRLDGTFVGTFLDEPDAAGNAARFLGGFDDIVNTAYGVQTEVTGRVVTGPIEHRPLFGLELSRHQFAGSFAIPTGPVPGINIFNPDHHVALPGTRPIVSWRILHDSLGLYLQDEIRLGEAWRLFGGGRFDWVRERDVDPDSGDLRRDQSFDNFAPRAGVLFQPVKPVTLYATYSRSFQPVGGANPNGQGFEPVKGSGYEVGLKVESPDGRLSGTLALYEITKENVPNPDPARPNFQVQTGEERSRGIELEVAGRILAGWDVIGSYALTDARVTEDTNTNFLGRHKPNVPEHAASLWTRYTFQEGAWRGLSLGAGAFYVGERPGDLTNSFRLPEYVRVDALVSYQRRGFFASLNVQNITNTEYYVSGGERTSVFPGQPFGVIGTVGFRY